jgi:hypothetical protein
VVISPVTNSKRRQRVEQARELIQAASAAATNAVAPEPESTHKSTSHHFLGWQWFAKNLTLHPVVLRVGLVAALLVVIAGGWMAVRQIQDLAARRAAEDQANTDNVSHPAAPSPTASLNVAGDRATASPSPSPGAKPEVAAKTPPSTSAHIASLTLLPISSRDIGNANSLVLTPEARLVRLNLAFSDAGYDRFEISVRTVDGEQVISRGGLKASSNETGETVTLTFDSSLLSRQDYIATLSGRLKNGNLETIGEYYFRVQHTAPQSPANPPKQ